jgi:hypothetical protein
VLAGVGVLGGRFGARALAWSRVDLRRASSLSPLAPLFRARSQLVAWFSWRFWDGAPCRFARGANGADPTLASLTRCLRLFAGGVSLGGSRSIPADLAGVPGGEAMAT